MSFRDPNVEIYLIGWPAVIVVVCLSITGIAGVLNIINAIVELL